jgi:hypothetical protein
MDRNDIPLIVEDRCAAAAQLCGSIIIDIEAFIGNEPGIANG